MKDIPIEQMDIRRLRVELSSALTTNRLLLERNKRLEEEIEQLKFEILNVRALNET